MTPDGLGELTDNEEEVKMLLKKFIIDEVEYVKRRASFAYEKNKINNLLFN